MQNIPKEYQYAAAITEAIYSLFDKENENYINVDVEFSDPANLKSFVHAMASLAPSIIYEKLTGTNRNLIEFNHMANTLCFEFCQSKPLTNQQNEEV